jgi:hypothetical protein
MRPENPPLILEYAALTLLILPCVSALWWLLPLKWPAKAAFAILYAVVVGLLLFVMALSFTCTRIGNCF